MNAAQRSIYNSYRSVLDDERRAKLYFERLPEYPLAAPQVIDLEDEFDEKTFLADPLGTMLSVLDRKAKAYLPLVTDSESNLQFHALLGGARCHAVYAVFGVDPMQVQLSGDSDEEKALDSRVRHWKKQAYEKLRQRTAASLPSKINYRRMFVDPILLSKGWTVAEWARCANVSHATAMDYLDEKTDPFTDTRKKLADALGVPIEQLP